MTKFPSDVSKVASHTEVFPMQSGGGFVNHVIRFVVLAGGQTGTAAAVESGTVDGTGNVEVGVAEVVDVGVLLVVEVEEAAFLLGLPLSWMARTMPTMTAASRVNVPVLRRLVRRLRCF
jgi:hypothetical protein